ncbi:DNA-invertase hin [Paraburkholderia nemoris]|uniref:recombinase family protein n=1 Tax=Paraburkholderia nemoris TaxID=2793076 RepID=UPI00190D804A|nr:recombinase family protein [Paraburkholderia nemoris]CAE6724276.1 DNA-invertase hin [Paraburkholderia nemoris]
MRVAIYVRVSTKKQTVESQMLDLLAIAKRAGWEIIDVFKDEGYSGAKSQNERPALKAAMQAATRREFDLLAIWSIDRLARSTADLVSVMMDLQANNVDLYAHQQAIDTSTPSGRMMWQLLGVFAEFERAMIRERVIAGLENAKARGVRLGRPPLTPDVKGRVLSLRAGGMGLVKIGRTLGIGTSQVQRICSDSCHQGA